MFWDFSIINLDLRGSSLDRRLSPSQIAADRFMAMRFLENIENKFIEFFTFVKDVANFSIF